MAEIRLERGGGPRLLALARPQGDDQPSGLGVVERAVLLWAMAANSVEGQRDAMAVGRSDCRGSNLVVAGGAQCGAAFLAAADEGVLHGADLWVGLRIGGSRADSLGQCYQLCSDPEGGLGFREGLEFEAAASVVKDGAPISDREGSAVNAAEAASRSAIAGPTEEGRLEPLLFI